MIQAVLFDAYGTLLHLDRPFERLRQCLYRAGIEVSPQVAEEAFRREMAFYKRHHLEGTPGGLEALRRRCAAVLFEVLRHRGIPAPLAPEEQVAVLMDAVHFRVYPDVQPVLRWCADVGLKTGIVSNWDCTLPEILQTVCPEHTFDCLLVSAAEGLAKPDRRLFARAAGRLSLPPPSIVHVGDDPSEDVQAASSAGLRALLLDREGGAPPGSSGCLSTLYEIQDILRALSP